MSHIVLKLGGTALSDGAAFARAVSIIESDSRYTIIVPSAPARWNWRMTELLRKLERFEERSNIYWELEEHLLEIARTRSLGPEAEAWISAQLIALAQHIDGTDPNWSYVISRGEYWSGMLLSLDLKLPLVDPAGLVKFRQNGVYDERATRKAFREASLPERFVMPGFYGSDPRGHVQLFPRNGSDISAAIVAAYTGAAELHIGRRGVPGIYAMNPNIYEGSPSLLRIIGHMSHDHAREMTYRSDSGALHPLALVPVARARITVRVFDVENPRKAGTYIVPAGHPKLPKRRTAIGIAERAGFTVFTLKRTGLNERRTTMDRVASVLKAFGLGYEHEATGVDHVSIVIRNDALRGRQEEVAKRLQTDCDVSVSCRANEGSICLVGHDLGTSLIDLGYLIIALGTHCGTGPESPGTEARLSFLSLSDAGTSIVFGVQNDALRKVANRLYREMIRKR